MSDPTLSEVDAALNEAERFLDDTRYTVDNDVPGLFRPRGVYLVGGEQPEHVYAGLPEVRTSVLTWALYRAMLRGLGEAAIRATPAPCRP